jgi:threonine dehydrogenase-like Zn-dependent dehydrogenase
VEAVGLCFSDLKLIRSYSDHARKSGVVSGIEPDVLQEISSYVPGALPTVPGHEAAVRVCAVGSAVTRVSQGQRYLVQTDYRWLRTAESNAAFGYNFEGALQQYVLMDERVVVSPEGDCLLLPAPDRLAASAIALVEPWACVEQAYANKERRSLTHGGRMLVVADATPPASSLAALLRHGGLPAEVQWLGSGAPGGDLGVPVHRLAAFEQLPEASCDDVLYFGARAEAVEDIIPKIASGGMLNIACCGARFDKEAALPVGRVHYSGLRVVGTPGSDPRESLATIPDCTEVRPGSKVDVVGAGGPMGVMHVVRTLSLRVDGVEVSAGDLDDSRLAGLRQAVASLRDPGATRFRAYNPAREGTRGDVDYIVIMVPEAGLVADAVARAGRGACINIFAGMPVEEVVPVDLNAYVEKGLYVTGTSGSRVEDMKAVLGRMSAGDLDTNLSIAAISGLDGAADGLRAVADGGVAGKVIVYPSCEGLRLTTLSEMSESMPAVGKWLEDGVWNQRAESALLQHYAT